MPSSNAWGSPYAPSSNGSSRFTIPFLVSPNAFVVVPFHQGVRDEKMLEKLATHDIQDVSALFSLVDKYTKAVKGHAWHSPVAQVAKGDRKPNAGTQAQGNNKKKKAGGSQPLDGAPTIIATAAGEGRGGGARGDKCPRQLSNSDDDSTKCTTPHNILHQSAGRSRSS
jgi:hypothetical protein